MNLLLNFIKKCGKNIGLQVFLILVLEMPALCSNSNDSTKPVLTSATKNKNQKPLSLSERLQIFYPVDSAEYTITICADLPDNNNPKRVYKKGEPGHVFLILSKINSVTGEAATRSFGFYPRVPVSCLFKKVKSTILDNNNREYDASIEKKLTMEQFVFALEKCKELSRKKYNLNRYNCYDYVLEVFNSLPGIEKLPVSVVKFPFIFGRGGSPCGLYRDLKTLSSLDSAWTPFIRFGLFTSPSVNNPQNKMASY
jgi:hypothetical protein